MLSSTVVAVFIALAYVIGSNGSDNTINSRFDTFSDRTTNGLGEQTSQFGGRTNGLGEQTSQLGGRTNGLSDQTNGLGEQTSRLSDRTNGLGEQTSRLGDRTNGLGEQTSRLSDLTDEHVLFQVTNQPDTEPAAKASMPNMSSANEYGVKERCERYTMKNQGLEREYYLYRPEGLKAGAPLVIVLHGYGGSALKGKKAMMDVADRNGFAVCYPQGIKDPKGKPGWNVRYPSQKGMKTDDVKFLIALSKELQKKFDLSPKNTFLTGMSNGGDIIYLIAMRAPKAFKAMASIAGLQFNWMETEYSYKHPLPFMEVHGTQDHTSEWLGGERRQTHRSLALQSRRRRPFLVRQGYGHLLRDLAVLQPMDRLATPLWSHIPPVSDTNPQFIECQKVEHHPLTFNILQNPALQIHRAGFTNIFIHNQLAITAKICKCDPKRLTLQ